MLTKLNQSLEFMRLTGTVGKLCCIFQSFCLHLLFFFELVVAVSGSGQSVMDPGVQGEEGGGRRWWVGGKGQSVRSG